jgi:hypothetical protein
MSQHELINRLRKRNRNNDVTQQSFERETNINTIMSRYQNKVANIPKPDNPMFYGDFSEVSDFLTCHNAVMSARNKFNQLPVEIRKKFNNQPAAFLKFVQDPKNIEECVQLGILRRIKLPEKPVKDTPAAGGTAGSEKQPAANPPPSGGAFTGKRRKTVIEEDI